MYTVLAHTLYTMLLSSHYNLCSNDVAIALQAIVSKKSSEADKFFLRKAFYYTYHRTLNTHI